MAKVKQSVNSITDLKIATTEDSLAVRKNADIVVDARSNEIKLYRDGTPDELLQLALVELLRLRQPVLLNDERLPDAIVRLAESADAMLKSGLTRRAIVVLLHDSCKTVTRKQITEVLDALPTLKKNYVKA